MHPQQHTTVASYQQAPHPGADAVGRARSPPNLPRSPLHDRAPPIKLVDPRTGRLVNVKPSRTSVTSAPLHNGSSVCRDFLERSGCQAGAYCTSIHVIGREHMWESINPAVNPNDGRYLGGFHVNCYDPQMVKYLSIPSDTVTPTAGSASYIAMFNENGENFKARFQVCKMIHETNQCTQGSNCSDIHTYLKDFRSVASHETHVCDEEALSLYRRLPPDVVVRVYQQNSTEEFTDYSGDQVLQTQGSQQYVDAYLNDGRHIPRKKMQHCAHFRLKRLCRMGGGCKFIHVIAEGGGTAAQQAMDNDELDVALQSQTSHPRLESPRSGAESPMSEVNVIIRERPRGSGYRSPLSIDSIGSGTTSPGLPAQQLGPRNKAAMGPADVAAMLAMRINSGSGVNNGPPVMTPPVDVVRPVTTSPSRAHNPYQPLGTSTSSTNSSFSDAKHLGSSGGYGSAQQHGSQVPTSPGVFSPYAPNYSQATVHAVPTSPENTQPHGQQYSYPPYAAQHNSIPYPSSAPPGSQQQSYAPTSSSQYPPGGNYYSASAGSAAPPQSHPHQHGGIHVSLPHQQQQQQQYTPPTHQQQGGYAQGAGYPPPQQHAAQQHQQHYQGYGSGYDASGQYQYQQPAQQQQQQQYYPHQQHHHQPQPAQYPPPPGNGNYSGGYQ